MNISKQKKSFSKHVIQYLITAHRKFQEELDRITSSNNDKATIEALIEIRAFNVNCLTRYSDIVTKAGIQLLGSDRTSAFPVLNSETEALWKINIELSKLLPVYHNALKSRDLNGFSRMIIGQNLEKIVYIKDNLLHPLPILQASID